MRLPSFIIILLVLCLVFSTYVFAECSYSEEISIEIEAINNKDLSPYQFPSFRESDYLALKSLKLTNTGNCTIEEPDLIFQLKNEKETIDSPFCIYRYRIQGNITPGNYYEVNRTQHNEYVDSLGIVQHYCFQELNMLGRWEITVGPILNKPTSPTSWGFKANNIYLQKVGFRVYSNLELSLADSARIANELSTFIAYFAYFSVIIAIGAIAVSIALQERQFKFNKENHKEKQYNLLHSLLIELRDIHNESKSYDEVFASNTKENIDRGKIIMPQYPIKILSLFYIRKLDNSIDGKSTENLKGELLKIHNKAILINDSRIKISSAGTVKDPFKRLQIAKGYYFRIDKKYGKSGEHSKVDFDTALQNAINILEKDFNKKEK